MSDRERVAHAIEASMFAPHELPLSDALHAKYLATADDVIAVLYEACALCGGPNSHLEHPNGSLEYTRRWCDKCDDGAAEKEILLANAEDKIERWRHIVMDILQADEGGQGLPFAEAMSRANAMLKEGPIT